jgi:glycosyltransferase involved in cell wall biosynthesis
MKKEIVFIYGKNPLNGMGGGPAYVRAHARAATRLGFEPHIFYAAPVAGVVKTDYGFIYQARSLLYNSFLQHGGIEINKCLMKWLAPRVAAEVERFCLTRPGPHLIHGFSAYGYAALLAGEGLKRRGVDATVINSVFTTSGHESRAKAEGARNSSNHLKWAVSKLEYEVIKRWIMRYEGRAFAESRLVTLNYDSVRRLFLNAYGPGAETRKLHYASESAFLHKDDEPPPPEPEAIAALEPRDAPLIVSVSRHDPRKGVDALLRALADLSAKGHRFRACLTSGGMLLAEHRRLAARLGIADRIAITGWIPDPHPYLRHADIFALPSLQEASGSLSLLEALQAGVAIVASDVDGIPEDVADGGNGLLVEPGNVDQLSRALARLLTDAELRGRLQRRARETFVERFSAEAFTDALRMTYAELGFPIAE